MRYNIGLWLLISGAALSVAGCGDTASTAVTAQSETQKATQLLADAQQKFDAKDYKAAAKDADEMGRLYPYAKEASNANLLALHAYYKNAEYDLAIGSGKRFLELYPAHPQAVQVQMIMALCYYDRLPEVTRDQTVAEQAEQAFKILISRYPTTPEATDAKAKLQNVREHLAGHSMSVGRYYMAQRNLPAALARFKLIVANYQDTMHVQEALYRITEAALMLGITDEARRAAATLGANYPESVWYKDAYALLQVK